MKKHLILTTFLTLLIFGFQARQAYASWQYYRSITVTSTASVASGTQTNFPMLVSIPTSTYLEASSTGAGARIQNANGYDIIFSTSTACTSPLNYEREAYTSSTGQLIAWINEPTLATGTVTYMCYGNPSIATDQSSPSSTWNSNFKAVSHMDADASSTAIADSVGSGPTVNENTFTNLSTIASGEIGSSLGFTIPPNLVQYASTTAFTLATTTTFSAWVQPRGANQGAFSRILETGYATAYYLGLDGTGGRYYFITKSGSGSCGGQSFGCAFGGTVATDSAPAVATPWTYVVGTYDGTKSSLYVNGLQVASDTVSAPSSQNLPLGIAQLNGSPNFAGIIDEVEVSNMARSADWILDAYNNQSSPSTFYAIGSENTVGGAPVISSFSASSSIVAPAGTSTLSWNATGTITNISISPGSFSTSTAAGSTTVNPTSTITYTLTATNSNGTSTATTTVTVDPQAPTVPGNLTVSSPTATSLNLSWASSTDSGASGLAGYKIYRGASSSSLSLIQTLGTSTSYTDTNLTTSTTYWYAVAAYSGVGTTSAESTSTSGTTLSQGITFINAASNYQTTLTTNTATTTALNGNLLYVNLSYGNGNGCNAGTISLTDNASNTYTQIGSLSSSTFDCSGQFYAANIVGSSTLSITATFSGGSVSSGMSVMQFSGVSPANPLDALTTGTNLAIGSTTITSASFSTAEAGEVVVAGASNYYSTPVWTPGTTGGVAMTIPNGVTVNGATGGNVTGEYLISPSPISSSTTSINQTEGQLYGQILVATFEPISNPTISSFTASSSIVASAGTSTLSFNVTNASSVAITPGSFSTSTLIGSTTVNPTSTITYTLTATNSNGTSTATTTVNVATAPTTPGSFTISGPTTSTLNLAWASSTPNNGATISFYTIFRGTSTSTMPQVATTSALSYVNIGLATSTTYFYYVTAQDSVGNISASSSIASTTTISGSFPAITWIDMTHTTGWPGFNGYQTQWWDPISHQTIHYGIPSNSSAIYSSDLYSYNDSSNLWTHISGTGALSDQCSFDTPTQPGERHPGWQMAIDTKRDVMWLVGGVNQSCNGTFVNTNGTAVTWAGSNAETKFVTSNNSWAGGNYIINGVTYTIASVTDATHMTLTTSAGVQTGVVGQPTQNFADMYYLNLQASSTQDTWTEVSPNHFPVNTGASSALSYDSDDDVLFLFGYDGGANTRDNWVYCPTSGTGILTSKQTAAGCANPDDWTQVNPASVPAGSYFTGMVYDTVTKKFIQFGGQTGGSVPQNQTWAYDVPSQTWTQKCQGGCTPPPASGVTTSQPSMMYDPNTHKIIFHQPNATSSPADWQYDPVADTWTKLISTGSGPTLDSDMAFDPGTNVILAWDDSIANGGMWQGQLSSSSSPYISSFSASSSIVASAGTSTLSFNVTNASSVAITPGSFSTSTAIGSTTVNPTSTTTYTLTATNANGTSTATTTVTVDSQAPTVPGSFTVSSPTTSTLALAWASSTDSGGSGLAGYKIYRGASSSSLALLATTVTTTTLYTDTGLPTSTTYWYSVAAYDGVGNVSAQSTSTSGTTSSGILPSISSFTASSSVVASAGTSMFSWNTSGGITNISITPGSFSTSTAIGATTVNPTSTIIYTLTATNANGTSTATTTVNVATPPTAPGSFSVSSLTTSTASLSWASSTSNNGAAISFYAIHRGTSTSTMPLIATTTLGTYADSGLANATLYYWYVDAHDSVGNISASSTVASGTTFSGIFPTISSFSASSSVVASAGTSTLSFNVSNASLVAITPGSFSTSTLIGSLTVNPTSTITYILTATNTNGTSTSTATVTVDSSPPSVPGSLGVTTTTVTTVSLSWASSTDSGGSGLAGYNIDRCLGSCTPTSTIGTATSTSFIDTGLAASTTYTYAVSAYDGVGNTSALSTSVQGTTLLSADVTPPSVSWISPTNNGTVSSTVTLTASSTDNVAVQKVFFYLAGISPSNLIGSSTVASGTQYSVSWDTTTASDGSSTLIALSQDTSNNTSSASITVNVVNPAILSVTTSTSLSFTASQGSTATSSQQVVIENAGPASSTLNWSATSTQSWLTFSPVSTSLASNASASVLFIVNPTGQSLGTHNATATISDPNASGSPKIIPVTLTISSTGVAVSITAPSNGATVSSTVTAAANPTSTVGIASVRFFLDGSPLGPLISSPPYQVSWNTASSSNGSHILTASTTDALANIATSSPFTVTVLNGNAPAIASFTASGTIVASAGTSTLSFNVTNASSVAIAPGSFASSTLVGSFTVNPTSTTIYTLTATNANGTSTATTTVTVANLTISNIGTSGIMANSATISWTTNIPADSTVSYGTSTAYGATSTDATLVTSHSIGLSSLTANTTYHFAVISFALATSTTSGDTTFTTSASASSGGGGARVGVASAYGQPYISGIGFANSSTAPGVSATSPTTTSGNANNTSIQSRLNILTAELDALLAQAAKGNTSLPSGTGAYIFLRNLRLGDTGLDVTALQEFLINQTATTASQALARHGVTKTFGSLTYNALKEFQKKAAIVPAAGYFGPKTRAYVNTIEGESTATNNT